MDGNGTDTRFSIAQSLMYLKGRQSSKSVRNILGESHMNAATRMMLVKEGAKHTRSRLVD